MYELDSTKAKVHVLSNDAFFWLKDDEDPIDENAVDEALSILAEYQYGYIIKNDWKFIDNGLIEATFVPYIDTLYCWDGEFRFNTNGSTHSPFVFKFKILNDYECEAKWINELNGDIIFEGCCKIEYIDKHPWAITPKGSKIPLWKNIKKLI